MSRPDRRVRPPRRLSPSIVKAMTAERGTSSSRWCLRVARPAACRVCLRPPSRLRLRRRMRSSWSRPTRGRWEPAQGWGERVPFNANRRFGLREAGGTGGVVFWKGAVEQSLCRPAGQSLIAAGTGPVAGSGWRCSTPRCRTGPESERGSWRPIPWRSLRRGSRFRRWSS